MLVAARSLCRALALGPFATAVALILTATSVAAQIVRPPPPVTQKPPIDTRPRLLPEALSDLVIQSVTVQDIPQGAPMTTARVTIKNQGTVDAVFPAGSVLAQGDAGQPGGIAFPAMTTPTQFVVAAGGTQMLTLSAGDVCAAGNSGTVTFRVDPSNVVRELNETNNTLAQQASSYASGDLRLVSYEFANTGAPAMGDARTSGMLMAGYPADELVTYTNSGTGPTLLCPGVVLWRETASPLSTKYGLREMKNTASAVLIGTGSTFRVSKFAGAIQPGDLPPGSYGFSVTLNPDGRMREPAGNNSGSTSVTVK